ncbi:xanthine dehydrogenase family protein molybdopterin-binding subunit [Pseudolabrys taiwanensis]|uniref:Xanthine dehydrogenase family protein molybdopterin-binding subunit n=1 Tax=Pseudolabrys taiwanensis TaxID=331696 RepID=A0A345ZW11_9HYPH|nr:xanthine dehydrogenase family protein molybdopterin-binding subunit [Pseudolabrys taiwanensis]AXK81108.1 xanthine dehydrogenase family protein molybdopterin-binding subunit [Pseudolabrys taiwanensis]
MSAKPASWIGASVERLEDRPLVTGQGRFAGDVSFPHQLHMRIVRSAYAHGRLRAIDTAQARALRGVVAIWTAADIADLSPIDFREGPNEKLAPFRQPVLARDMVRYAGEPVAAVFATDPYVAEDAADLVEVDIEELDAVTDASLPVSEFAAGLTTEPTICRQGYGDIADAFKQAATVVELDLSVGRHSGVPLETRGAIGRYDAARDVLELHGAAKVPHKNRESLARMLGRSTAGIHLYEGHVGGGFGIRGEIYPEDILVLVAAMRLGRPVKWLEDRREHMIAANHSRQQRHRIRAAVDAEGRLIGIDDDFFHDQGGYIRTHGTRIADTACGILPGPYRLPHFRVNGHFRLTNKTPAATYRAPGRYETNFVRERLMDAIARELGLSRIEVRRRNLISPDEMPYERPLVALGDEVVLDSGDYAGLLDKALDRCGWDELERKVRARREAGEYVGLGLAMYVEKSGLGPTDGARVNVHTSGEVEVITGGASVGQGFETVIAQVCADTLGVDYRRVRVVHGRTDRIEYGIGAHATRATVMTANATAVAAAKVRDKALDMAAQLLQADAAQLTIADGNVMRRDGAGATIGLGELAHHLRPVSPTRGERDPGLAAEGWFTTDHMTYPYGVQIAQVALDAGTGAVRIEKMLIAFDVGRAINPMLVRGQLVGGFVQGLGGALFEEFQYDERGQPLSVTFADYLMPTAHEVPEVDILLAEDAPSTCNPLGIKGAGEGGVAAVGAVIASAVDDALGGKGLITQIPITPQAVKAMIDAQRN